jgi:hypothetical protein
MTRKELHMNRTLSLALAFAAGVFGGTLSGYITPTTVLARADSTAPKDIRAQRFTLVNEHGAVVGVLGIDDSVEGAATLRLFDDQGHEIFRAGPPTNRLVGQK